MKNINAKYMDSGMAILTTSSGTSTIYSPFSENITIMVKSRAMRVIGEIRGMNLFSYQLFPLDLTNVYLVIMPAMKGMPR